jgi:SAM-dependent methyltransferase
MPEWYKRFFSGLYDELLKGPLDLEKARAQMRALRRLLGLHRGAEVLDVPCGIGRMSIALAQMGMRVTGVDLMTQYVRRVRREARKAGVEARFLQGDMRDIEFESRFDLALNWFTSFGYFDDEGNLRFLLKALRALRPGGRIVIEVINRSALLARWRDRNEGTHQGGALRLVQDQRFDARTSRIEGRWTVRKGMRRQSRRISLRVYDGTELRAVLRRAGFRDIRLYADAAGKRFSRHSWRLLAVARRPKGLERGRNYSS